MNKKKKKSPTSKFYDYGKFHKNLINCITKFAMLGNSQEENQAILHFVESVQFSYKNYKSAKLKSADK